MKEKQSYVSLTAFIPTFIIVVLINIITLIIFSNHQNISDIQYSTIIIVIIFWLIVSWLLTMLIRYNALTHYERPMKTLAKATKQVANGDFSVYVDPIHTSDKLNYLDIMILDFNKMVEELGSVETLKTDFLSNVSHEIKTPLAIIQNYSELLKRNDLSNQQRREYTQVIYDTTKRLSSLITNILKLNKLEKQNMIINNQSYDLCQQLCDCILGFENLWDQKNIDIHVNIEDKRMIDLDEALMELVWNNLLSNAIKFTPQNGTIQISEHIKDNTCYVIIEDSGCGMSNETMEHIFEKFYQGDTSHATQGNGLGLALALRVIQLSNAELYVSSEQGKGSVFTVEIPINEEVDVKE